MVVFRQCDLFRFLSHWWLDQSLQDTLRHSETKFTHHHNQLAVLQVNAHEKLNSREKSHRQNARPLSCLACDKWLGCIYLVKDEEKCLVKRPVTSRHMKTFIGKVYIQVNKQFTRHKLSPQSQIAKFWIKEQTGFCVTCVAKGSIWHLDLKVCTRHKLSIKERTGFCCNLCGKKFTLTPGL